MTLSEFLTARLDEDEAAARDAFYEGQRWLAEEEGVYLYPADDLVYMADRKRDAVHIVRWQPARVLREVEAKRKILAGVVPLIDGMDASIEGEWGSGRNEPTGESALLLKIMAAVYSDHPDYDTE